MSRYWKAALPFLLAAVIILAAASRPVVLHIGFPCDSYWNVPGENYYTFIDAAIEKFDVPRVVSRASCRGQTEEKRHMGV